MLYLLDSNVLITAHNLYYPIDMVPEFWEWLLANGTNNCVKMPIEMIEEIEEGKDDLLLEWMGENQQNLLLSEDVDPRLVQEAVYKGYADDLADHEVDQLGRDPFLIAYALVDKTKRVVVTTETSSPKKIRQNRKIPDVCCGLGVACCDTFALNRKLGFRTSWRRRA